MGEKKEEEEEEGCDVWRVGLMDGGSKKKRWESECGGGSRCPFSRFNSDSFSLPPSLPLSFIC